MTEENENKANINKQNNSDVITQKPIELDMFIINKKRDCLSMGFAIPSSCIIRICNPINTIINNVLIYLQILK